MNGLDPQGMFELRELIIDMAKNKNKTFFITSHLLHEIEQVSNIIAVIQAGKVIEQGKVADLLGRKTEEISIFTDSATEARHLIKNLDYVQNVKVVENGLSVQINKGYSGKLNKILVNNDIVIEYIIPRKHSLEDYDFFNKE
jgi:ABC-type multidrug transport system ATPase subunit